jgi:hypothetical protein
MHLGGSFPAGAPRGGPFFNERVETRPLTDCWERSGRTGLEGISGQEFPSAGKKSRWLGIEEGLECTSCACICIYELRRFRCEVEA